MLDKIKTYLLETFAVITAIALALFYYQRNKNITDEALLRQQDLKIDLAKDDSDIAHNNEALQAEEAKRAALEKDKSNEKPSLQSIVDSLNTRK